MFKLHTNNSQFAQRAVFLLQFSVANAQIFTYSGTVVNSKLEPIPFINVAIKDLQRYERTDEQGKFSFRLTPGRYELVFSRVGYKTFQKEIILGHQNKNETILLQEDSKQLSTLVISANQKDRSGEIIRNVIEAKNAIQKSAINYSFTFIYLNSYIYLKTKTVNLEILKFI